MPEEKTILSNERIESFCLLLSKQLHKKDLNRRYAPIKKVLTLIGMAGALGLTLVAPGIAPITKQVIDSQKQKDENDWKQYNPYFLKRTLQRLRKQKMVEISLHGGKQCITLTVNGKRKILKYALNDMGIEKQKIWDRQWRLILYDIEDNHKKMRDVFRGHLKALGFFQLQKSVWIYPYPCEEQISFLREYDGVGNEVLYIVTNILEDDTPYREYFGVS